MHSVFLFNEDCRKYFKNSYHEIHTFITAGLSGNSRNSPAPIVEPFQIKIELIDGLQEQHRLAFITAFNTKGNGQGNQVGLFEFKFHEAGSGFRVFDFRIDELL